MLLHSTIHTKTIDIFELEFHSPSHSTVLTKKSELVISTEIRTQVLFIQFKLHSIDRSTKLVPYSFTILFLSCLNFFVNSCCVFLPDFGLSVHLNAVQILFRPFLEFVFFSSSLQKKKSCKGVFLPVEPQVL